MAPSRAILLQRAVRSGVTLCKVPRRTYTITSSKLNVDQSRLPTVASPSFWTSLVPKFMRRPTTEAEATARAKRRDAAAEEKRTGLVFLLLGILVGSNAINIIGIKRDMLNFTRQTDAKLELLREVIERVRRGEEVNVKKLLGTGDAQHEQEWEEVIKELERTDMLWQGRKKRDAQRAEKVEQIRHRDEERRSNKDDDNGSKERNAGSNPKFLM